MLTAISIRNIVLIERCDIAFSRGLCVLTGETGAGKSILLDALGLALGMRGEARLVRQGCDQASVSATFDVGANEEVKVRLAALDLPASDEIIIRRSLGADGKTRAFVNDVAVSVAALRSVGEALVEIHGQHDGRGLLDPASHRAILDEYAELGDALSDLRAAYEHWKRLQAELAAEREALAAAERERDYLTHMRTELADLTPFPGEEESLAETRSLMMQSEKLSQTLADAKNELAGGKGAAGMIHSASRLLSRSSLNAGNRFGPALEALERAGEELGQAEEKLEALTRDCAYDPLKLERAEERLFALRAAGRKYDLPVAELPRLLAEVEEKLAALASGGKRLENHEHAAEEAKAAYRSQAEALSASRVKAAHKLEKAVAVELGSLKMAATRFAVALTALPEERWSGSGMDAVQFEAATHKGAALAPLHKIASGGELSRFMLAMKVALAKVRSTPTLIFDEIDTGTGGAVADAIGQRLAALGASHQVLVVTHLPQVAARGNHHLLVLREDKPRATFTRVDVLGARTRQEELARMLAGAEVTAEARRAAARLLKAAG